MEHLEGLPLARLVADEVGGPSFLVLTAPALYFPGLAPLELDDQEAAAIGAVGGAGLAAWLILTVRPSSVTANLLGPVVVNPARGLALQVVRRDLALPVAAPVVLKEPAHA